MTARDLEIIAAEARVTLTPELRLGVTGGGSAQRTTLQHYFNKQTRFDAFIGRFLRRKLLARSSQLATQKA
jgi:hypothetical protein